MSRKVVGGCLCGAVRFEAGLPALFCAHCHCAWCRRAHGAAFVTWLGIKDDLFRLTKGMEDLRWFGATEEAERGFCPRCGTKMLYRTVLAPGEMHVALGCVDDTTGIEPKLHVFWEAHVPWLEVEDTLPKAGRDAAGLAKYQVIARAPL